MYSSNAICISGQKETRQRAARYHLSLSLYDHFFDEGLVPFEIHIVYIPKSHPIIMNEVVRNVSEQRTESC